MKDELILGGAGGLMGGGKTPKTTPDTLHSEDTVEFTLAISEGPIGGLLNGPKTFYLSGTPAMSPSGESNFTPFQLDIYHGDPLASVIHNELGGVSSSTSVNVALAANTPVTRTTSATLRTKLDVLEVRLQINQLVQSNAGGDQLEETAQFKIQYRRAGQTVWLNFFADEIISLTGKTTGGAVKEFRKKVPRINNDWEIRVTKISADNVPYHLVAITWESFQCVTSGDRAYNDLAVVKGIAKASDQFSSIPEFSGVYAGKLVMIPNNYNPLTRHYTGVWDGTFILGHTDNPAWVTYDILMNPKYGMKRHFPQLLCDRFTFYEGARWCDQLVPRGNTGTFQPRYTYNDVLSEARPGIEHARYVAGSFGAVITSDMNKTLRLKTDMPASIVQVFGPESVTPDQFSYQFSDITQRVNDITISFVNPDLEWDQDVRQVKDDAYINLNGRIPSEPIAVGCIDPYEAQRRAYNMLLKANTEITTVSFQTARSSLALEVFDVVGIADPDMNWGLSGRVKSVAGQTIMLRDFLQLPVGTDITMQVQTPTGVVTLTVRTSSVNTKTLVIQGAGVYPANAPDRAQFTLSSATVGLVKPFRVMSITPDGSNPDVFSITALEVNTNRYADADNLSSSGTVNYQGVFSSVPAAPTITVLSSGLAHQVVAQDGAINSRIAVELSLPAGLAGVVEVFYRRQGIDSYQSVQLKGREGYISNVQIGVTYDVYAVMVAQDGRRGPPSNTMTHTVLGRTVAVTTPTPWTAVAGFDTITLTGAAHPAADFSAFKIYGATVASATPIYLDTITSTKYVRRPPVGDTFTRYKISAVNRSGVESAMTAFVAAVPKPPLLAELDSGVAQAISAAAGSAAADVTAAQNARDAAVVAKDAAVVAQGLAVTAKNDAQTAFTAADAAKTAALGAQTAATTAKTQAETAKTQAETAFAAADAAKTAALASQTAAAGSATAASGFANTASTQATAAGTSATAAAASATAANTSSGSASTSASQAATSATNALGSANSAATSATTSASALTDTQRALAAASTIVAGKASTALLPYGSAAAGTMDSFTVFSAANYGADTDGPYLNRSSAVTFAGGYLRAVAPSTDGNVYRITAKVKATAANIASIVVAWINSDGTVNSAIGYLNTAISAGAFTTLTITIGRVAGGLVTHTGGTLAVWNAASYMRFGVRSNTAAAGQFLQIYDIQVDDLTAADAAARQATAALASADAAATSATAANASQTAAGTSASAAATSATNANTSAGTAGTSATAASNSATAAAGSASAASTSATAAVGSASAAGTQATAANTSAGSAATSASNATTSATSAQSSLVAARLSVTNAPVLPYDFTDGVVHWTRGRVGSPASMTDPSAATIVTDTGLGQAIELGFNDSGATASLMTKGVVTLISGRVYRVTIKFKLYAATNPITVGMFCQFMNDSYVNTTSSTQLSTALTADTTTVVTFTRTFSDVAMAGVDTVLATFGTSRYARFGLRRTTAGTSGADTMRIGLIQVQDVTQEVLAAGAALTAGDAASAASGSATLASTKADAAGVSATAASASANTASTQAGNASTSATAAAASATTALGHSNSAATSATTAASTQQAVDRAAAGMFPQTFLEDGRFFTSLAAGAPTARTDLAAPWIFSTDGTEGRVASLAAPQGADQALSPKGYIAAVVGRSYKITVRAKHVGAFVGLSATSMYLRIRGITSTFTAGAVLGGGATVQTFAAPDTWYDFTLTGVYAGSDPYLTFTALVFTSRFGTTGPTIAISKFIVEDVTSALAASGAASAAIDAQTAAAASQTASANSASAAALSAVAANTSAGGAAGSATAAGTSETNAATSASGAAGSAGAAATSALTASNSSNAAVVAVAQGFPVDFVSDRLFYQSTAAGAPSAATPLTGSFNFVTDGTNGRCYQITPLTAGDLTAANTKGVVNPVVGRRFRLTVRARYSGTVTSPSLSLRIIRLDSAYATPTVVAILTAAVLTTTMASYTLEYTAVAADTYLRFGIIKPTAAAGAGTILVQSMVVEDITSETAANGSASAAAGSASTATTQAGNAGNSATAASNSSTAASGHSDTASGHAAAANTASISASAAKVDAEGASAAALEYRNAAARMTAGGVSKNPVLNSWTGALPDNLTVILGGTSSTAKVVSGVRYVNAIDLIGSDATQSRPIMRLSTVTNTLDCVAVPDRIIVRAEIELISGSITSGSLLSVTWNSASGGVAASVTKLLSDSLLNVVGKIQTIEWYIEKPATYVPGTTPNMLVDLYTISNVLGATRAPATLRVHRFDFEVVTANSMAETFQQAKVAVDGIQTAAVGMRAVAGSAGALLELVALSDPQGGSASVARISADNIILDGSVKANHLTVGAGTNLASNTDFTMGLQHWTLGGSGAALTNASFVLRSGGIGYSAYGKNTATLSVNAFTQTGEAAIVYAPSGASGQIQYGTPVAAGQYYEFSAQLSLHRLNVGTLQVEWLNISGVSISTATLVSLPVTAASSSVDPDLWPRYGAVSLAPAGAAYARLRVSTLGVQTGQTNSYIFLFKPFIGVSKLGAALSPYSGGGQTVIDGGSVRTNSLTADRLNTTSLTASGLAIFGGTLQSTNFVAGVSGWKLSNTGDMELNNLVARGWIQSNAVSDTYTATMAGPTLIAAASAETTQLTLNLGPFTSGNVLMRLISFEGCSNVVQEVTLRLYRRIKFGAVWESWVLLESFSLPLGTGYRPMAATATLGGVYDDYEYQVRTVGNSGAPSDRYGYFKNLTVTAVKLVR